MSLLVVESLTKSYRYKSNTNPAVKNVSFRIKPGEIVGLLGPNGAGKTTTIKIISGLIKPDSGSIVIGGVDLFTQRKRALSKISSVLEGNRNIYWKLTPVENLEFFAALKGVPRVRVKDKIEQLVDFFNLKKNANMPCERLSRGYQQRVAIAVALISDPELLLLDEPTLGLDVHSTIQIIDYLNKIKKNQNRAIVISSHMMGFIQKICDRVIIIDKGEIRKDEALKSILNIFANKLIHIFINGDTTGNLIAELKAKDLFYDWIAAEKKIVIRYNKHYTFYNIIDIFRKYDIVINSIETLDMNLEQIFLQVLGDC